MAARIRSVRRLSLILPPGGWKPAHLVNGGLGACRQSSIKDSRPLQLSYYDYFIFPASVRVAPKPGLNQPQLLPRLSCLIAYLRTFLLPLSLVSKASQ